MPAQPQMNLRYFTSRFFTASVPGVFASAFWEVSTVCGASGISFARIKEWHAISKSRPRKEEGVMARKYSRKSQKDVRGAMHEFKRGQLKSGRSGRKVKSRKQAIAIGMSKARKHGAKVPPKKSR